MSTTWDFTVLQYKQTENFSVAQLCRLNGQASTIFELLNPNLNPYLDPNLNPNFGPNLNGLNPKPKFLRISCATNDLFNIQFF